MVDDSIAGPKIEEWYVRTDNDTNKPELDGDNEQLNVDQQSYGEQLITDGRNNVTKNCDQEITKAREMLENNENVIKKSSKNLDNKRKASRNSTFRQ